MICKKDHAVGVFRNGFLCDVFFGTGIGESALHCYTCAGHKSHGNVVSLQIIIDIRPCERQGFPVQFSGNGNNVQVRIGCCLVEDKQAVGKDCAVLICNKINQVQAGCAGIDIDGVVFCHKFCGTAADFFLFFRKTSATLFIRQKGECLWSLKCCDTAIYFHDTATFQKDVDISSDGVFGYVKFLT